MGMSAPLFLSAPQFVNGGAIQTVAQLKANSPAGSLFRGMYARVTDYAGEIDRVLRCDYFSVANVYRWIPTQADYGKAYDMGSADLTVGALTHAKSIILTGTVTLGTTRQLVIDVTDAWPGMVVDVRASSSLSLLGALQIAGTGLASVVALLAGNYKKFVVDASLNVVQMV
jgi:hypothetical protein